MRASLCTMVAAIVLAAHPAFAQTTRTAETFWKTVQATCDATAARPPSALGQRIAQNAIDEFTRFGGHRIDSNGRLFHFGLTEAEHEEDDGGNPQAPLGHFGWWQVMKYWRTLFGGDPTDKLEVRGYRDASTSTQDTQEAALLRTSAAILLRLAEIRVRHRVRRMAADSPVFAFRHDGDVDLGHMAVFPSISDRAYARPAAHPT